MGVVTPSTKPARTARKKLVLDSMVAVPTPGWRLRTAQ